MNADRLGDCDRERARERKLTVKELAAALGRHTSYVYKARRVGFVMRNGVATVSEWRAWVARTHYHVVHGDPAGVWEEPPKQ
jgi:hypothetical protein